MPEPVYIALDADGRVTLFRGDGTEDAQEVLAQGARPPSAEALYDAVLALRAWAEAQGFRVIVPAYDLAASPPAALDLPTDEAERITWDAIDELADDLNQAG